MNLRPILLGGVSFPGLLANAAFALLRIYVGLVLAFNHGLGKLPPSERFIAGVERMGFPIPEVFAFAAGLSEFVGGLLLALGLLTRPASFSILTTMHVAGFVRHAADPFGGSKELAIAYACCALMFLVIGSGRFGLDVVLQRRREP